MAALAQLPSCLLQSPLNQAHCKLHITAATCLPCSSSERLMRGHLVGDAAAASVAACSAACSRPDLRLLHRLDDHCDSASLFQGSQSGPCTQRRHQSQRAAAAMQSLSLTAQRPAVRGVAQRRVRSGATQVGSVGASMGRSGRLPLRLPLRQAHLLAPRKTMRGASGGSGLGCSCCGGRPASDAAAYHRRARLCGCRQPAGRLCTRLAPGTPQPAHSTPEEPGSWRAPQTAAGRSRTGAQSLDRNRREVPDQTVPAPAMLQVAEAETAQPKAAPTSGRQAEIYIGHSKDQVRAAAAGVCAAAVGCRRPSDPVLAVPLHCLPRVAAWCPGRGEEGGQEGPLCG